ncbi:MAG: phosphatase PAP2 family protein [Myxococcota bacterium]
MRYLGLSLLGAGLLSSAVARADIVTDWNEIAIDVGRRLALGSNRTTRVLAITHLAVYDAVESVTRNYQPYSRYFTPRSAEVSVEAAVAQAAHDALLWLNPSDYARLDAELERSLAGISASPTAKLNGIELGRAVASEIVYSRLADGSSDVETYDLSIPPDPSAGGTSSSGGASGGASAGGASAGGASAGGASAGGATNGGATNGGATNGGATSGGATSGGGGATSGGATSGGATNGGAASGASNGGASSGGASSGGTTNSVPVNPIPGAGLWRPTPRAPVSGSEPAGASALEPQWRGVTPFALSSPSAFRSVVTAPPALVDQLYTNAYNEVKTLGAFTSVTRTSEQTDVANFWRQETQVPFNAIARSVAQKSGSSIEQNARLFALLNVALADARIATWDAKYLRGYWRPITAIRLGERDGNPATAGDASWRPLIETPGHPSFVSGHSATGAAGAAVLSAIFGDNTAFTLASDTLLGKVRSFTSFSQAAAENAESRVYAGVHFRFDNEQGLALGKAVGERVATELLLPASAVGGPGGADAGGAGGWPTEAGAGGEIAAGGSALGGALGTSGGSVNGGSVNGGSTARGGSGGVAPAGGAVGEAGNGGVGGNDSRPDQDEGCSCSVPGHPVTSHAPWALVAVALLAFKRRRDRSKRP